MLSRRLLRVLQPLAECWLLLASSLLYLPLAVCTAFARALHPALPGAIPSPRCVAITGASSGIGAALALRYARPGVVIALAGRNKKALEAVAAQCRERGADDVIASSVDVKDAGAVREWLEATDAKRALDIVIANAGTTIGLTRDALPKGATDAEVVAGLYQVNVIGTTNTAYSALDIMKEHKRGQIAIVGSVAAGAKNGGNYAASKAAVRAITASLRPYARPHGVAVTLVEPGWVTSKLAADIGGRQPFIMNAKEAAEIIVDGIAHADVQTIFPFSMFALMQVVSALPLPALGLFPLPFLKFLPKQTQL